MADRPQMFGPTRGFLGMADSMEPCKNAVGPTLVAIAKIASKLACIADRLDMFWPTMGATFVAMATTHFGLGAEISRLPACLFAFLSSFSRVNKCVIGVGGYPV